MHAKANGNFVASAEMVGIHLYFTILLLYAYSFHMWFFSSFSFCIALCVILVFKRCCLNKVGLRDTEAPTIAGALMFI